MNLQKHINLKLTMQTIKIENKYKLTRNYETESIFTSSVTSNLPIIWSKTL